MGMDPLDFNIDPVLGLPAGFSLRTDVGVKGVTFALSHGSVRLWGETVSYATLINAIGVAVRIIGKGI